MNAKADFEPERERTTMYRKTMMLITTLALLLPLSLTISVSGRSTSSKSFRAYRQ